MNCRIYPTFQVPVNPILVISYTFAFISAGCILNTCIIIKNCVTSSRFLYYRRFFFLFASKIVEKLIVAEWVSFNSDSDKKRLHGENFFEPRTIHKKHMIHLFIFR